MDTRAVGDWIAWSPLRAPFGPTNGLRIFTTTIAASNAFYRLRAH